MVLESPLLPMIDDLGPSDTVMMTALGPAWQKLAENIKAVDRIARSAHSRVKADESANLKIAALHSLLGERVENFGTPDCVQGPGSSDGSVRGAGERDGNGTAGCLRQDPRKGGRQPLR